MELLYLMKGTRTFLIFFYRFKGFETVASITNKIFVFNIKAEYGLLSELKF